MVGFPVNVATLLMFAFISIDVLSVCDYPNFGLLMLIIDNV